MGTQTHIDWLNEQMEKRLTRIEQLSARNATHEWFLEKIRRELRFGSDATRVARIGQIMDDHASAVTELDG